MTGKICAVKHPGGYFFIRPDSGQDWNGDIFGHCSALVGLEFGEHLKLTAVEFDIEETERGKQAVRVRARD